jgi:hypothetical protein
MLSTLLESGFNIDDFEPNAVCRIASHLESQLKMNGGKVGFSKLLSDCKMFMTKISQPWVHCQTWTTLPKLYKPYI